MVLAAHLLQSFDNEYIAQLADMPNPVDPHRGY